MRIDCCVSYFQKQLIGLLPSQAECLFYYSPNVPVGGYTVEGFPFDSDADINLVLNPLGIYYTNYYDITDNLNFIMTYVGTSQPTYIPQVEDSLGNPVTITWDSCCTKTCYEITLNTDWTTDSCKYFWFGLNVLPFFPDGLSLNDQAIWQTILGFFYGPQVVVTNTVTATTVYLKIDNAYICDIPKIETQLIPSTDMVPCGYVPPVAPYCYYYGYIDFQSEDITQYYLDAGAFLQLRNDIYGNGNLRNYFNTIGGDIYWFMLDNDTFTFQGTWLYYYGNAPMNLDIYDSSGNIFTTIYFQEGSASGVSCDSNYNYEMTFDKGYNRFSRFGFESINNINAQMPTSTPYTSDYTDLTLMQDLITWTFGNGASYSLIDNGATYTMQIRNAIYWNGYPRWELYDGGGNTIQLTMTPF